MRLLLVEDEASAMRRLVRLVCDHLGDRASLCCVDDVAAAVRQLQTAAFDGILLDLNLGGSNGFEVMRAAGRTSCVVVSAHADRSLEAFDHAVLDFVPKPIVPARLARALDRLAATGAGPRRPTLVVRTIGRAEIVNCDDLVRIQGADDYAELVTIDGRHLLHDGSLALLERRLPANFVRVHRSHIVNVMHASAIVRESGARPSGWQVASSYPSADAGSRRSSAVCWRSARFPVAARDPDPQEDQRGEACAD